MPLSNPMRTKAKPIVTNARTLFPALSTGYINLFRILIGSFRCELFTSVVIGQGNYFCFGFMTLN